MLVALVDDPDTAEWLRDKGDDRQLRRLWERPVLAEAQQHWERSHTVFAGAPYDAARLYRSVSYMVGDSATLFYHQSGFYSWNGASYPEMGEGDLRASLYGFLDQCVTPDDKGKDHPFKLNKSKVANVLDVLANLSD